MGALDILAWAAMAVALLGLIRAMLRLIAILKIKKPFRSAWLLLPIPITPRSIRVINWAARKIKPPVAPGQRVTERFVPVSGAPDVRVLLIEREGPPRRRPALLWIHGGGYVMGTPDMDNVYCSRVIETLDLLILAVDYRLSPEHPFPAALDDCHAVVEWLACAADELGVDLAQVAIGGQSAGGGLAATLTQRLLDHGPVRPAFQLLVYPMLDDRTCNLASHEGRGRFLWTARNNTFAWSAYLGCHPGGDALPPYAVAARREKLTDQPPTWIGVGTLDLFYPECASFAGRLRSAGVNCQFDVIEGAYHGFEMAGMNKPEIKRFHAAGINALAAHLTRHAALT